ncbi:MAG: hypothetical protein IIY06_11015 [Proteobacteria bacterium]|nr:hypothetical protein [Pseudomonadota bacterium]
MKKNVLVLLLGCLLTSCQAPHYSSKDTEVSQEHVMHDAASHGRDEKAEEALPIEEISKNITVTSTSHYPVWRENIAVTIDSVFVTNTKRFVSARTLPKILIYAVGAAEPSYWSVINLSTSFALANELKTLLVLPVGSQKSISSPISKLKWADMNAPWPHASYYSLVPTGEYEFELALEIYDEQDKRIDVIRTPKQKYSSISASDGAAKTE